MKRPLVFLLPLIPLLISGYYLAEDWVTKRRISTNTYMLGDGRVMRFPGGKIPIYFLGRDNENTLTLLPRLDSVLHFQPRKIFFEIGLNDLRQQLSEDSILANYQKLITRIHQASPTTQVYVQSVLPVVKDSILNKSVFSLNSRLKELASKENAVYMNIDRLLVSGARLNPYLSDGNYLNEEGYGIWKQMLRKPMSK
jgi:lysophospholipase L1-like esterase